LLLYTVFAVLSRIFFCIFGDFLEMLFSR